MVLVDTNVLIDVIEDDAQWADWSIARLREISRIHDLVINPIVYAELSLAFEAVEDLDATIDDLALKFLELPKAALFLAGKAFVQYRRQGGRKTNIRSDFFIGAHAAVMDWPILTRDTRRYRSYFGTVQLIAP